MPGKTTTKPKSSAGESGLSTETTSGGQSPDHSMNPEQSSVAAPKLPGDDADIPAECKAFEALFGDSPDEQNTEDPHHETIDVEQEDKEDEDKEDKDNEEEDAFLLPES